MPPKLTASGKSSNVFCYLPSSGTSQLTQWKSDALLYKVRKHAAQNKKTGNRTQSSTIHVFYLIAVLSLGDIIQIKIVLSSVPSIPNIFLRRASLILLSLQQTCTYIKLCFFPGNHGPGSEPTSARRTPKPENPPQIPPNPRMQQKEPHPKRNPESKQETNPKASTKGTKPNQNLHVYKIESKTYVRLLKRSLALLLNFSAQHRSAVERPQKL